MPTTIFPPVAPGTILKEEFMEPMGISQNALARAINVPSGRINEILKGERAISADTALRLARYFRNTPGFWMNLQGHYEIELAEEKNGAAIRAIKPIQIGSNTEDDRIIPTAKQNIKR